VKEFTVEDLRQKYGVERHVIQALVRHGFVEPERGVHREYRFSFRDVVVLRMAQDLWHSGIPITRTVRFLRQLQQEDPELLFTRRLSASGREPVVRDGDALRNPSGQLVMDFGGATTGQLHAFKRNATVKPETPTDWFDAATRLEASNPRKAQQYYRRAIELDIHFTDAYINLCCLLVEDAQWIEALVLCKEALSKCPAAPLLYYNLGVVYEELESPAYALESYELAIKLDPTMADAHYNAAILSHTLANEEAAIRHFNAYRKLTCE
jgi:tetratricopeptide (TPR) repeat protein